MRITLELMGTEVFSVDLSIPRFGLFAPGVLSESFEAIESFANGEDEE